MKGKLVRVKSEHQNLRSDFVEGNYDTLPIVGERFCLIGESLSFRGGFRLIETSVVQTIEQLDDHYRFTTEFSTYDLF